MEGGVVTKSLVVVTPAVAAIEENTTAIRSRLVNLGFVVIREESRNITSDVAAKLVAPGAEWASLVGNARLLAVARVDATKELQSFAADISGVVTPVSDDAAVEQLLLLFPRMSAGGIPTNMAAHDYVDTHLKQVLIKALTQAAKTKPENPVKFVAEFLLSNNPNKPPVSSA